MAQMRAGQAVIEALRAEGVEYTFGVVGTTTNSIVTEMHGRSDIRFVDTRHEEGAAFMAYGYARASGKPAACITTSGPGTINLLTGISLAYKGRAPVMVIAGDVARDYIDRDGSQAFDLVGLFKPITKLALQVNKTERVLEMLHYAFRTALSGKQGPVFLDIPRDLLDDQAITEDILPPAAYRAVEGRIAGDPQAIQRAVTLLAQAQRPLLLTGGGVIDAEASAEAVALAEWLDMALVPSYGHHDTVPNSHRLYIGPPGGRGSGE
ncbi:MAG TPA: thiamine pyrophosphate-binding protein, partial [Candidatus Tectomicrobia bacterium]